jgi:AcrR family transcriptional regulator
MALNAYSIINNQDGKGKQGSSMGVLSRREREKLARRSSILQAAREEFYLNGYQAATIDKIAERAELSKGTIYSYFDSKDELYVSALIDAFLELEKVLIAAASHDMPIDEKLKALYFAFVDHCMVHKEQLRLGLYFYTQAARKNMPRHLIDEIDDHTWKALNITIEAIQEGKDTGVLRDDVNPTDLAIISWRTAVGLLEMVIEDSNQEDEKMYLNLLDQAINLMLRAIKKEPASS